MSVPETTAWTEFEEAVDEQTFTPWAPKGWLSHNGQSPEIAVVDFVRQLIRMMNPEVVVETGVGQGYTTRSIASALEPPGKLVAFESDDDWRLMIAEQFFWTDRRAVATLSPHFTPPAELLAVADLCVIDSDFSVRFDEIILWDTYAKQGSVAVVHDTADRDGTVHRSVRDLIVSLGMTGVFLQNPRGCFMAVQSAKET